MKSARFHAEAQVELFAESQYYEERSAGLGRLFIEAVESAVRLASTFPEAGSPYRYGTRRVFPKRFPFSVVYQVLENEIVILAIAPFPRKPTYWHARQRNR